jgi:tetratricopeptide (TPR) repeat protein
MKKSSIFIAAALSFAIGGCAAHQKIDPNRMQDGLIHVSRADSLYSLSEEVVKNGQYQDAIGYLEEILEGNDRTEKNEILFNYGMARTHLEMSRDNLRERQKNRVAALDYFEKVIELTDGDARFNSYRMKADSWARYLGKK